MILYTASLLRNVQNGRHLRAEFVCTGKYKSDGNIVLSSVCIRYTITDNIAFSNHPQIVNFILFVYTFVVRKLVQISPVIIYAGQLILRQGQGAMLAFRWDTISYEVGSG